MAGYTTYKRWRLKEGVEVHDVLDLVRRDVAPHYRRLDPAVRLGLESITGTPELLATQRWPDQATHDRAMSGDRFRTWWRDYEPILGAWDELVDLVAEWESHELL